LHGLFLSKEPVSNLTLFSNFHLNNCDPLLDLHAAFSWQCFGQQYSCVFVIYFCANDQLQSASFM